ncbi:MAG: DUF805 domain-containing protein [Burkholderiaceae bacterium]|jgi:uncharacterized membrane protein YhaH (DUF805 family)|nr:DUF805 domain-containing protein [Burkholderiaceae bacterium]
MPEPTLIDSELNPQPVAPPAPVAGENNRYAAPRARVADVYNDNGDGATQPVKLFSAKGRMGRLRLICWLAVYSLVVGLLMLIVMVGTVGFTAFSHPSQQTMQEIAGKMAAFGLIMFIVWIISIVFMILLMIKRSHDMNWSGWSVLAVFGIQFIGMILVAIMLFRIPIIGVVIWVVTALIGLIWFVKPGTPGPNRFGPPPTPTPLGVKIVAWIFVALYLLSFINLFVQFPTLMTTFSAISHRANSQSMPR